MSSGSSSNDDESGFATIPATTVKFGRVVIDLTITPAVATIEVDDRFWPDGAVKLDAMVIPPRFRFSLGDSTGTGDTCGCADAYGVGCDSCCAGVCSNVSDERACTPDTCSLPEDCGNRLVDHPGLELRPTRVGIGVFATRAIRAGNIVAPYWGVVRSKRSDLANYTLSFRHPVAVVDDDDADGNDEQETEASTDGDDEDWAPGRNNKRKYRRGGKSATRRRKKKKKKTMITTYVDAEVGGGIARFVNHSCNALCTFEERKFVTSGQRTISAAMVIVAAADIPAGSEVTVDYGDDLWFWCQCSSVRCRNQKPAPVTTHSRL